jgi:ribosomal protein L37E
MKQILITWQMGPKNMFVKSISCKNCQTHIFKMKQHVCLTEG